MTRKRTLAKSFALFGFALILGGELSQSAQARIAHWSDIRSWEPLSPRWAVAKNSSGKRIAVYDLSFRRFFDHAPLGIMGDEVQTPRAVAQILDQQVNENPEAGLSLSRPLRSWIRQTLENNPKSNDEVTRVGLAEMLPENWWKAAIWKDQRRFGSAEEAPERFTLADFAFESLSLDPVKFSKALHKIENFEFVDSHEDFEERQASKLGSGLLSRIEFQKLANGSYQISYTDAPPSERLMIDGVSRPLKIIDYQWVGYGALISILTSSFRYLLSFAVGQIPNPFVGHLLEVSVTRIIELKEEQRSLHLAMFLEVVEDFETGDLNAQTETVSEIFQTAPKRNYLGKYLTLSEATLISVWKFLFKSPTKVWKKALRTQATTADRNLAKLGELGFVTTGTHSRFRWAKMPGANNLMSLSCKERFQPHHWCVAIDYLNPEKKIAERKALEMAMFYTQYWLKFVPYVGGLIFAGIRELFSSPIRTAQWWESRLISHLERNDPGESFKLELDLLHRQNFNPFLIDHEQAQALVLARRKAFGI